MVFFSMPEKTSANMLSRFRCAQLFIISLLMLPGLLLADGQRYNPWAYPGTNGQLDAGNRPWANMPPGAAPRQYNGWREPTVGQPYPQSGYPYSGYRSPPYTTPYYGYGDPYNPYQMPGYGGMNGIYPGLHGGPTAPETMFLYPGW